MEAIEEGVAEGRLGDEPEIQGLAGHIRDVGEVVALFVHKDEAQLGAGALGEGGGTQGVQPPPGPGADQLLSAGPNPLFSSFAGPSGVMDQAARIEDIRLRQAGGPEGMTGTLPPGDLCARLGEIHAESAARLVAGGPWSMPPALSRALLDVAGHLLALVESGAGAAGDGGDGDGGDGDGEGGDSYARRSTTGVADESRDSENLLLAPR